MPARPRAVSGGVIGRLALAFALLVGAVAPPRSFAGQPGSVLDRGGLFAADESAGSGDSWVAQWLGQRYLLGDWAGLRPALEQRGIVPRVSWVIDVLGNLAGGLRRAVREFDDLGAEVDVDLARLWGAPGTKFHAGLSQRSGTSLSTIDIGNVFNVAQVCCGATVRVVDVSIEQPLWDDRVTVRLGRLSAGDNFLSSPLYSLFVNSGINGTPSGILFNAPGMTVYPVATWGAEIRVTPVEPVYVMAGVYNGDPTLGENEKHGLDWTLRGPVFAIVEIGYRLGLGPGASVLPGRYRIGAYYNGGAFTDFLHDSAGGLAPLTGLPARTVEGNTGFYALADQMLYRDGGAESRRGVSVFAAVIVAPAQSINTMPLFIDGGVVVHGLVPRRPHDVAGFAVIYGAFSEDLRRAQRLMRRAGVAAAVQDYELVLEWAYSIHLAHWAKLEPDVQYIVKPGGSGAIPNAVVAGFQLTLAF